MDFTDLLGPLEEDKAPKYDRHNVYELLVQEDDNLNFTGKYKSGRDLP